MTQTAEAALSLEITRTLPASPEAVFQAWLSPLWAEWLPPRDVTCTLIDMDPREGGLYHLKMVMPNHQAVVIHGQYREIAPFDRLVFTWRRETDPNETVVSITFRPDAEGTVMTLRQMGFADPELCARHSEGWGGANGSLQKLREHLAAGN